VSIAADTGLIVGVGTHLDSHTAALCDGRGRALAQLQVSADPGGYAAVVAWARGAAGNGLRWAVEGTRHYGLGLARYLAGAGEHVEEIDASRVPCIFRRGTPDRR
jgi:transposase